jgi:acyl-CoA dehydrogenase
LQDQSLSDRPLFTIMPQNSDPRRHKRRSHPGGFVAENIVVETAARIFTDLADTQTIIQSGTDAWKTPLWDALVDAGLTLSWVPENCGGSGADLADGFGVLQTAGRTALAAPLAETMLAGWLLSQGKITCPPGVMTLAPVRPNNRILLHADGTVSGEARGVSYATQAQHLVVLAHTPSRPMVALMPASICRITPGHNLADDALNGIAFDRGKPLATAKLPDNVSHASLMMIGAVVRSLQIAGALETILQLTVQYANERVAFERKIAKFQAVQHHLARLAGEVAAAVTAATSAADALSDSTSPPEALLLEAAAAKIRCGEAAETATAIAHQIHGAMGFTREHVLHRYTLRALAWRDDFGTESYWAAELGQHIASHGADQLWPLVASR